MADYYIDFTGGDDTDTGLAPGNAWKTKARVNTLDAGAGFNAGDTINFKAGETWASTTILTITSSGGAGNPIIIQAYDTGADPIIQNPAGAFAGIGINIEGDWITIQNLHFTNCEDQGIEVDFGGDNLVVQFCEFDDCGQGIRTNGASGTFNNNYFHDLHTIVNTPGGLDDFGATGISFRNGPNTAKYNRFLNCRAPSFDYGEDGGAFEITAQARAVSNCVIQYNWAELCDGFIEVGGSGNNNVANNVLHHNVSLNNGPFATVHFEGAKINVTNLTYDNNTIVEEGGTFRTFAIFDNITAPSAGKLIIRNNIVYVDGFNWVASATIDNVTHTDNLYYRLNGTGLGFALDATEIDGLDPLFVDRASQDFQLQGGSPAIDIGGVLGYTADFIGTFIPQGSAPDAGAYEFISESGPILVAVTRVAVNTGVGNQDITTTKLNGLTPKAAWFVLTRAQTTGVAQNGYVLGMGAATSTSNQWTSTTRSENNVGTTDSSKRGLTDHCIMRNNATDDNVECEAEFVQFLENGVRINWTNAPATAVFLTVVLFAGSNLQAKADTFTLGNQNITVDVATVGFQPEAMLVATSCATLDAGATADLNYSNGAVTYDGDAIRQNCWMQYSEDGVGTSNLAGYVTGDYGCGEVNAGGLVWQGEFLDFDADGFSCIARNGNSNDDVGYLALSFNGEAEFWTGIIDTPVAIGNQSISGDGLTFTPQFIYGGLTQMDTLDLADTTGDAGSVGASTFDATDEYCNSWQDEDAQGTTDTQSLSSAAAIDFPQDDGTAGHAGTFVSFDTEGFTWNFSATLGTAKKWWILAIEGQIIPPPSDEIDVVVVRTQSPAGAGIQDIVSDDLAGKVPSAALFTITNTSTDGTEADDAVLGVGAVTTNGNQWSVCVQSEDAVATTNTNRRGIIDGCVLKLRGTSSAVDGEAEFVSFIQDGVRINWTNAPSGTFSMTVVLFSGVKSHADVFTMPNVLGNAVNVTGVGFKPELVFTASIDRSINDTGQAEAKLSHGCIIDEGSIQHCWAWNSQDNVADSVIGAQLFNNYGIASVDETGVIEWGGTLTTFDGDGFSVINQVAATASEVAFLALSFDGDAQLSLDIIETATVLGRQSIDAPGFKPYFTYLGTTQLLSANAPINTDDAGGIGICAFDEDDVGSDSIQDQQDVGTTNTTSFSASFALDFPVVKSTGKDRFTASGIVFTEDGWSWDYSITATDAPRQFWALAVGQPSAVVPGGPPGQIGVCKIVANFQVFLKDANGTVVALFDDWRLLQFQRKINSSGFFNFIINGNDGRTTLFEPDGQIEIYRIIPGIIDWQRVFEGHIENFDQTLFQNGNFQFSAIGSHYNGLLARRIIAYNNGTLQANKSAVAETVMKEYVDENIGPSATFPPRLGSTGVMDGFAVEADGAAGNLWQGDRSGKKLMQVLQEIANFAEIDFDVVGTGTAAYEFRTYANQLGIDRTVVGLDPVTGLNAAGNAPHIFSPDRDNVLDMRYALKRRKEANAIYIFGQGQTTSRSVELRTDLPAIAVSPIGKREAMRGGGSQSTLDDLRAFGDEQLERLQAQEVFTFAPLDVESSLYGVHYNFGDSVTARIGDIERNKRITAITFTVAGDGETKQIEFSDIP